MNNSKPVSEREIKYTTWDRICDLEPFNTIGIWYDKVTKIIDWIPILWEDADWEGTDTLRILDYKLSRLQRVLAEDPYHCEEDGNSLSGPRYAKEVQEARDCIKRILEDDYCAKEWEAHDEKYGKLKMVNDGPPKKKVQPVKFVPDSKASLKARKRILDLEVKRKKDDYDKLGNILKEKIDEWWT